ncbi:PilZ domain-containing protein [Bosea psychrotolerans]|uniref:PilZ domain-containing protein n=1 Tax=Bosea psychrotolerans TaxID=1871628 RepID=A0A2S4MQA6_9HYPH|nr:PilZ domain-containing protein [Bosea psychrotolerans]POR56825.1 PilZ domain-containing protein [Bosea psychrotolerans]
MENRSSKRWRSAKLFDASQRFLVECRVMDLSPSGARLRPESDRPLPLALFYHADDKVFAPAALIWIRKREIGIRFLDANATEGEAAAPAPLDAGLRNGSPSDESRMMSDGSTK